jgi:hypothetical protein
MRERPPIPGQSIEKSRLTDIRTPDDNDLLEKRIAHSPVLYTGGMIFALVLTVMALRELLDGVTEFDELDDRSFHEWQFQLVQYYRRHAQEQEPIAVAVIQRQLIAHDSETRRRLDELQAMLDSAHDPMI